MTEPQDIKERVGEQVNEVLLCGLSATAWGLFQRTNRIGNVGYLLPYRLWQSGGSHVRACTVFPRRAHHAVESFSDLVACREWLAAQLLEAS